MFGLASHLAIGLGGVHIEGNYFYIINARSFLSPCVNVCIYIYMYVCTCVCVCVCVWVCVCVCLKVII